MTVTNEELTRAVPGNFRDLSNDEILAEMSQKLKCSSFDLSIVNQTKNRIWVAHSNGASGFVMVSKLERINDNN